MALNAAARLAAYAAGPANFLILRRQPRPSRAGGRRDKLRCPPSWH